MMQDYCATMVLDEKDLLEPFKNKDPLHLGPEHFRIPLRCFYESEIVQYITPNHETYIIKNRFGAVGKVQ